MFEYLLFAIIEIPFISASAQQYHTIVVRFNEILIDSPYCGFAKKHIDFSIKNMYIHCRYNESE
jgi:hypothetical protein